MTVSERMEITTTLFFTDTAAIYTLLDSIRINLLGITSNYEGSVQQFADTLAATYNYLFPLNLPENPCATSLRRCRYLSIVALNHDLLECGGTCTATQIGCLLGCHVGTNFAFNMNLRDCQINYTNCISAFTQVTFPTNKTSF